MVVVRCALVLFAAGIAISKAECSHFKFDVIEFIWFDLLNSQSLVEAKFIVEKIMNWPYFVYIERN